MAVTSFRPGKEQEQVIICFDIITETLKLTNLSSIKISDKVNFERSLKIGDEIGGHIVSGHNNNSKNNKNWKIYPL